MSNTAGKKNILLILTDQQSATMMSCAGNKYLKTPAIDSIAETGMRFDLAFCTNPVCVPSRFSLFTGRYPSEIGQRQNKWHGEKLPEDIVASGLGHKLREAGYETVYGGKEHLPKTRAEALGFNYICKDQRDELAEVCADYLKQPHEKPFFLVASFINPHDICHMAINQFAESDFDLLLKRKCVTEGKNVEEASKIPEGVSEEEFYERLCPPLPENHEPQKDEPEAVQQLVNERGFRRKIRESWKEKDWRLHRRAYCKLTEKMDGQVGVVLEALKDAGLEDDTVVIFTSDHGDHDSSHKLEHKTALYEEVTRIPFVVRDPDCLNPGTTDTDHIVCNGTDIYTTLCDYAGTEAPNGLKGLSFRKIAEGGKPEDWREEVLVECQIGHGIRTKDMFYALYDIGENREQLYDLEKDPGQTRNFAGDPGYRDKLQAFREKIAGYPQVEQFCPGEESNWE